MRKLPKAVEDMRPSTPHTHARFSPSGDFGCGPATMGAWGRCEPPHQTAQALALKLLLGFAGIFAFDVLAVAGFGEFFKEG